MQLNNVGMVTEGLQEYYLPESPLGVRLVTEGVEYLLYSHYVFGLLVNRLPHYAVGAFPESFLYLEPLQDVLVDLRHVLLRALLLLTLLLPLLIFTLRLIHSGGCVTLKSALET